MTVEICIGHAAINIKRRMREYEEILQYDRKIITFLKAQIPPLLRRQIRIMIAHHKKLVPFQPGEKFPASLLTAGAEIAQMIHKVMIAHDRVPSPDHFQIHRVGIRKRPFFIKSYILITEVGVSDQDTNYSRRAESRFLFSTVEYLRSPCQIYIFFRKNQVIIDTKFSNSIIVNRAGSLALEYFQLIIGIIRYLKTQGRKTLNGTERKALRMDTDSINRDIGRRIRNHRNRNGLTQQELADRTELTKGFISQLERGQVSASVVTLMDLIECLGTTG